jgi:microcin C transport system substrate-binding protein
MIVQRLPLVFAALLAGLLTPAAGSAASHGLAIYGDLKYGPDFKHFDYVNPQAPKRGEMKLSAEGDFDTFNPFVVRGTPAVGVQQRLYDTLLVPSADEPFSEYGLLAESIDIAPDRSWVSFTLRPEARWQDGKPVTADDVLWSFETLRSKGLPFYRSYYANVAKAEKTGERAVKFTFQPGANRELPLIVGQLPVLPKHYWEQRDFEKPTLEPPLGGGPYKIDSFDPGRRITYRRLDDYWGKNLPVNVGRDNFDVVTIDYYRDPTVEFEAFKAGGYDLRAELSAKNWATGYDFPALKEGKARKENFANNRPAGMQSFAFNTRRELFKDRRVRQALAYAFDFEWSNKNLFYDQYTRTRSYFDNSELAAKGLPGPEELQVLEPLRDKLPSEVFTQEYNPPKTDGTGNIRANLGEAVKLLKDAGWEIDPKSKKLTDKNGRVFEFEVLLNNPLFERIVLPFSKNLERLGIEAKVRTVDTAQFTKRAEQFDYDVIIGGWGESLSPGNEQREFWGSAAADQQGSMNWVGIKDPAIDTLIEAVVAAPDRKSLVARVRALDRALQWNHFVIPMYHIPYDRIAYWDKFGRPDVIPEQGVQVDTWWAK